jgi:hypothetical protein
MGGLPGVRVGPLDPDVTESFGQVSGRVSARQLIRQHAALHPPALISALSKKLDDEFTQGLDLSEVGEALADDLPDGVTNVVGAQIRGERDKPQVLTFTYETESGRTAKWFVPLDDVRDSIPASLERGEKIARFAEAKRLGLALTTDEAGDPTQDIHTGGAEATFLRRENARLKREAEALRARLEGRESAQPPADDGTGLPAEPVVGYEELNADDAKKLLADDETTPEEVAAILAYEKATKNRKSVVSAAEQKLGSSPEQE